MRKTARRALHALRSRGVRAPEAERVGRLGPVAPPEDGARRAEAWVVLSPPLVVLMRVVRTASERPLSVGLLDEEERVVEGAAFGGATKHGVRDLVARKREAGEICVPVAPGHAAARLRAAVGRPASPHGKKAGMGRAELAERLAFCDGLEDAEHPALALAPEDPVELEVEAGAVIEGLAARDLPFALSREHVGRLPARLNEAQETPIILVPGAGANREAEAFRSFVDEDVPAAMKVALGLRFLDRAWASRARGEERRARGEAACGFLLLRRPASGAAQALLLRFAALHVRPPSPAGPGGEAEERPPERRSQGGIILP